MSSFFDYLEKVRQKPEKERRRLLLVWTFTLTAFIVGLWLINIYIFMPRASNEEVLAQREQVGQIRQNINEVTEQMYFGFSAIKETFQGMFGN